MKHPGPKSGPRLLAGRLSRAEKVKQRSKIDLEDSALTEKTKARYYYALHKMEPWLERVEDLITLDELCCDWVIRMWKRGEPLLVVGDGLSALHFFQPFTKRNIPHAWKLFATWRKLEVPARAPPLTQQLVRSMSSFELDLGNIQMATLLVLGFHALLRTGEILSLRTVDVLLGPEAAIIRLRSTKTSQRFAAHDAISITDKIVLELLSHLCQVRREQRCEQLPLWNGTAQAFRVRFGQLCEIYGLQHHGFRPYSLRRGGATALFQNSGSMETTLARGRWESSRVAKIYINDALSYLPSLQPSKVTLAKLDKHFYISPSQG